MDNKYLDLINAEIKEWHITLDEFSTCRARTHAHAKDRRICKFKPCNSYASLFLLLHEIGHIETDRAGMKRCEQESEATRWTIKRIKALGLPIKQKQARQYKRYIKRTYNRGIRRGLSKRIKSNLYI